MKNMCVLLGRANLWIIIYHKKNVSGHVKGNIRNQRILRKMLFYIFSRIMNIWKRDDHKKLKYAADLISKFFKEINISISDGSCHWNKLRNRWIRQHVLRPINLDLKSHTIFVILRMRTIFVRFSEFVIFQNFSLIIWAFLV